MAEVKIVLERHLDDLETEINALLSKGYKLHGLVSTHDVWMTTTQLYGFDPYHENERVQVTHFIQVMIKE